MGCIFLANDSVAALSTANVVRNRKRELKVHNFLYVRLGSPDWTGSTADQLNLRCALRLVKAARKDSTRVPRYEFTVPRFNYISLGTVTGVLNIKQLLTVTNLLE